MTKIDVVVPVYRNQETLAELAERLQRCAQSESWDYRLVFVNDASPDGSGEILDTLAARSSRTHVLHLTSNVGQQAALLRGLKACEGDFTAVLDADLQDPPEALPRLMAKISEGYEVVFAGRRGHYESSLRLLSSCLFKSLVHARTGIPRDAGAFFLMTRKARIALCEAQFRTAFLPGMVGALGLRNTSIPVPRQPRPSGRSAYRGLDRLKLGLRYAVSLLLHKSKAGSR